MYRTVNQLDKLQIRSFKIWLALNCLFTPWSDEIAIAQVSAYKHAESDVARLHSDNDFREGSENLRNGDYERAVISFRKSLKVRNHASVHIAIGKALLGKTQSSDNSQTKSVFLEAISQFEFYPLALKQFRDASTGYLAYLKLHKKYREATKFEKLYQQRLKILTNDADGLHSSREVNLNKYKRMQSITGI